MMGGTRHAEDEVPNMNRKWKMFFIAPVAILCIALFIYIGGEVVMRLWNWLLPPLFGWHQVTFWQAVGLLALCRILFGSHGWRGPGRARRRMSERWGNMTPEEREKFRQGMRGRCGPFEPPSSAPQSSI
jgi:hypothetical protein